MKTCSSFSIKLLLLLALVNICVSKDFDFFYLVQSWPGSFCDTRRSCCFPSTGRPAANFSIHGLWPNYNNGSWPSDCNPHNPFDESKISDLIGRTQIYWPSLACPGRNISMSNNTFFWAHEWDKHGTCSESVLEQHGYFETFLNLKDRIDLLHILQSAGIKPDGNLYSLNSITEALKQALGYVPGITCNIDALRNSQLYEIYLCVDKSASEFIECPVVPRANCRSQVEFPLFGAPAPSPAALSSM